MNKSSNKFGTRPNLGQDEATMVEFIEQETRRFKKDDILCKQIIILNYT